MQKNSVRRVSTQNNISHKTASMAFMIVMFITILLTLTVSMVSQSAEFDISNFWINMTFSLLLYALYFVLFLVINSRSGIRGKALFKEYGLNKRLYFRDIFPIILIAGLCIVSFMCVQEAVAELWKALGYVDASELVINSFGKYALAMLALAVAPAIVEELLFRGLILKGLQDFGKIKAVFASAVLFSLYHLSPSQTFYQFVLGIVFAALVVVTGRLVYSMLLHFINNAAVLTYTYLTQSDGAMVWSAKSIAITIFFAVAGALLIYGLIRTVVTKDNKSQPAKAKKFISADNVGYAVCIALAALIWIMQFMG